MILREGPSALSAESSAGPATRSRSRDTRRHTLLQSFTHACVWTERTQEEECTGGRTYDMLQGSAAGLVWRRTGLSPGKTPEQNGMR